MVYKMTEEEITHVGGKPIEEYRERVEEGNDWWDNYCAERNEKMYKHHLFPYAKVAIGCQLFPDREISSLNNPRRYVGEEDEEPKV